MRRSVSTVIMVVMLLTSLWGGSLSSGQALADAADYDIPNGHFYTQANGTNGVSTSIGFAVVDDANANLWSEYKRLGSVSRLGYIASWRFQWDGFWSQATQRVVMQWRPDIKQVYFVNVFDKLHDLGKDAELKAKYQVPFQLDDNGGFTNFSDIVRYRQSWLDANPKIKAYYFSTSDPLNLYGLPTSHIDTSNGAFDIVRLQRIVIQYWKVNAPGIANAGDITVGLGGDIAKALGVLPGSPLSITPGPVSGPTSPSHVDDLAAAWNNGGKANIAVFLSNKTAFPSWTQWANQDGGWIDNARWVAGDFNGDGHTDTMAIWNNGGNNVLTVRLSTGNAFLPGVHWNTSGGGWIDSTQWLTGDFNGDGKTDVAAAWNNGGKANVAVFLSTGTAFPSWTQWANQDGGWIDNARWVAGDYNGDGKTDLAAVWNNGGNNVITIRLSTGSAFQPGVHWNTSAGGWIDSTKWLAGDYNGDGVSDLAAAWNNGGKANVAVFLSTRTAFPSWTQWANQDGGWIDLARWVAGDYNGDGKTDLAAIWNNGGNNVITIRLSKGNALAPGVHWNTSAGGWIDSTKWLAGSFH